MTTRGWGLCQNQPQQEGTMTRALFQTGDQALKVWSLQVSLTGTPGPSQSCSPASYQDRAPRQPVGSYPTLHMWKLRQSPPVACRAKARSQASTRGPSLDGSGTMAGVHQLIHPRQSLVRPAGSWLSGGRRAEGWRAGEPKQEWGTGELWMGGVSLSQETAHGRGGQVEGLGRKSGKRVWLCLLFWWWGPMGPAG